MNLVHASESLWQKPIEREKMLGECHAHIFMNGIDYQKAREEYEKGVSCAEIREDIRSKLEQYQKVGITFLRDGGDHYGASVYARSIADEYGIDYRSPVFAIHRNQHYGKIVGLGFDTMKEYHDLVRRVKREQGDFIKVMFSGIMDFTRGGSVTGTALDRDEIREMIHIAHEEGFAVMAHVNGAEAVRNAAEAGVDSVEHGNFMDDDCIHAMAENKTVWVPTHVTIRNLLRSDRYDHEVIHMLEKQQRINIRKAAALGVSLAAGSDAGAFMVSHGSGTLDEYQALKEILGDRPDTDDILAKGLQSIMTRFRTD